MDSSLFTSCPDWGPFADGYPGAEVDLASWAMVFIDIGVAGWLALSGWRAVEA